MDFVEGIVNCFSLSGGAGSSLSKSLAIELNDHYKKCRNVSYALFPSEDPQFK